MGLIFKGEVWSLWGV